MVTDKDLFQDDWNYVRQFGVTWNVKFNIALEIIRHAALVAGKVDGEDSAGRQKIDVMPAEQVAIRALDIAGHLVDIANARGWLKAGEVSAEDRNRYLGKMRRLQYTSELKGDEE